MEVSPLNKLPYVRIIHLLLFVMIFQLISRIFPSFFQCICSLLGEFVLFFVIAGCTISFTKRKYLSEKLSPVNKAVFITGCDTGFGHLLAAHMDSRGYHVFAGCLQPSGKGAQELKAKCSGRLRIVELDVTKDDIVQKAYKFIRDTLEHLEFWAVVNNAGISEGYNADLSSMQEFENTLNVNCLGMVRVTKTFMHLLIRSKGRVVNVTSMASRLAMVNMNPYITSKFGACGFHDSLRHEMETWEIRVISIEPGFFRTPMNDLDATKKSLINKIKALDPVTRDDYGEKYFAEMLRRRIEFLQRASPEVHKVIDCLESAVSKAYPDDVYMPVDNYPSLLLYFVNEALWPNYKYLMIQTILSVLNYKATPPQGLIKYLN